MATAAKIKSAIASRGASQRGITRQLAGVTEQLQKAEEASLIAQSKEKQSDSFLSGLDSLVGIGYTVSELIGQKRDIDEGIEYFKESLGEKSDTLTTSRGKKASLIDVFRGSSSIGDFLKGEERYSLGGKDIGSRYDISTMGQKMKLEKESKDILNLLELTESKSKLIETDDRFGLGNLESPKSVIPKEIKNKVKQSYEDIVISDEKAEQMGFNIPESNIDEDLNLVSFLGDPDLSIQDFKKFADLGFPSSYYGTAE